MAPPRDDGDDSGLLKYVLAEIRADREEQFEFRKEMRDSLRSARQESTDFREEVREDVETLKNRLDVRDATEAAVLKHVSKQKKTILGLIGVVISVASALAPFLFGLVLNLFK